MNALKNSVLILTGLILSVALWLYSDLLQVIFSGSSDTSIEPSGCTYLLSINGEKLLANSFEAVFVTAKDKEFVSEFFTALRENRPSDERRKEPGINFKGNFSYFQDDFENRSIDGFVVPIINERKFKAHIEEWFSKEIKYKIIDKSAVIVSSDAPSIDLDRYLNSQTFTEIELMNLHPDELVRLSRSKPIALSKYTIEDVQLHVHSNKNTTQFSGDFLFNEVFPSKKSDQRLKPSGFSLYSRLVPKEIDSMVGAALGLTTTNLNSISINYYGMELVNLSKGIAPVPKLDLLLSFDKNLNLTTNDVLNTLDSLGYERSYVEDQILNKKLNLRVTENKIVLYSTPTVVFEKVNQDVLFNSTGDLSQLLVLSGNNLVQAMLEMNQTYIASKRFINSTEKIDLEIRAKGGKGKINGSVKFKDEKELMIEVLRLLINLN